MEIGIPARRSSGILEAADWFKERTPEVRDRFVSFVGRTISAVKQRPYAFPVVFGSKVRRAKVSKFKYSVYFFVDGHQIFVISVFHDSRNPIIWRGRID